MIKKFLKDFSAGMWIQPDGTAIPDNACIDLINMRLSEKGYPTMRFGSKKFNTTTMSASYKCRGIFINERAATDAKFYIYIPCGGFLYYSTGDGTFTKLAIGGTDIEFAETVEFDAQFFNGVGYFCNGEYPIQTAPVAATATAIKVDGTTCTNLLYVDANSFQKNISMMTMFNRRLYCAKANSAIVYVSVQDDPEDYYDGTNNLYTYFGQEDGEYISGIHWFENGIVVAKPRSIYRWFCQGSFETWQQDRMAGEHPDYGCHWHRSIAPFTFKGRPGVAWLGWPGVVHFDGRNCTEISAPIRSDMRELPQSKPSKSTWQIDDKSEWDGGTTGSKMFDTSGGELMLLPQTTTEDFAAGTDSSTEDVNGAENEFGERERYLRHSYIVDDFEDGLVSRWTASGTETFKVDDTDSSLYLYSTTRTLPTDTRGNIKIAASGDTGYWGFEMNSGSIEFVVANVSGNGYSFSCHRLYGAVSVYYKKIAGGTTQTSLGSASVANTDTGYTNIYFHCAGAGAWTVYVNGVSLVSFTDTTYTSFGYIFIRPFWPNNTSHVKNVFYHATGPTPTGNFTSQTIDFGVAVGSSGDFGRLAAIDDKTEGGSIVYQTYSSSTSDFSSGNDASGWVVVGYAGENGGVIKSAANRYLRWRANFTTTNPGDNPKVYTVFVGGQYISSNLNASSVPTDIGRLVVTHDVPEGTSIRYFLETAATEGGLDGTGWVQVNPNEMIDYQTFFSSSEDWVRFKVLMTFMSDVPLADPEFGYENSPRIDRVAFEYYVGDKVDTPCGWNWLGDYHIAVDRDLSGNNESVYICNENGAWARDTHLNISCAAQGKNRLITGSSVEGFARWTYEGYTDDGNLIPYKLTTKDDYGAGTEEHAEDMDKCFRRIQPTAKSDIGFIVRSKVGGKTWKERGFPASKIMKTYKADLDGMNSGQYIRYQIVSSAYDFSVDPQWPEQNTIDYIYWHEDEYIYFKSSLDLTTIRRYYKPLNRVYTEDDEMGFWMKVNPVSLGTDGITLFGFFNTNNVTNKANFVGLKFSGTEDFGYSVYDTDGTYGTASTTYALSTGTDYYMEFTYNGAGEVTARLMDTSFADLITAQVSDVSAREWNVNAWGMINHGIPAGTDDAEWQIKECLPFFKPSLYSGVGADSRFETLGLSHEFLPLLRIT